MNPSLLAKRTNTNTEVGNDYFPIRCILHDYRLVFNLGQRLGSYYASVEPMKGDSVHGLLYSMTTEQWKSLLLSESGYGIEEVFLDGYDQNDDGKNVYGRLVEDEDDISEGSVLLGTNCGSVSDDSNRKVAIKALTLRTGNSEVSTGQPSSRYMRLLRMGAREQRLHPSYQDYLAEIEYYKRSGR
eukprot:CAMPEP_0174961158 /NCGR_PEP_ID=MMETSP0004_2-20121128/4089_1 /TAXON_ID=420556 /ORGANISM="Ochromonas sp., Strain CCMP1393" /LENGTH=184 /DNA_ID=CAMNT_0016209581 /DNA_START=217 /DNA_END=771 /DNA_ORIENTATION=+